MQLTYTSCCMEQLAGSTSIPDMRLNDRGVTPNS